MSVLPRGLGSCMTLVWLGLVGVGSGCGDAHWATATWPDPRPEAPIQPVLEATEIGLEVRVTRIEYEPDGIRVTLALTNTGAEALGVDPSLVMLGWDELEYAPEPDPAAIELELGPGIGTTLELHYQLSRPLTVSTSRLVFRAITRDALAIVDVPTLELPAMPSE